MLTVISKPYAPLSRISAVDCLLVFPFVTPVAVFYGFWLQTALICLSELCVRRSIPPCYESVRSGLEFLYVRDG